MLAAVVTEMVIPSTPSRVRSILLDVIFASNLEVRHALRLIPGTWKQIQAGEPSGEGWLPDLILESEFKQAEIREQVLSFCWRPLHRQRGQSQISCE